MTDLLLSVCIAFLKIGAFSFGGSYSIIAFIQREIVQTNQWIDPADFVNIVAIAEMTPGPIAVNSSTFVGYNLFGIGGGILCSLCTMAIPFALALVVSFYFTKFKENQHLKNALSGIRPAVIGLIAAACVTVAKISIDGLYDLIFFCVALFMVWRCKINPIIALLSCGGLGILFYSTILPAINGLIP